MRISKGYLFRACWRKEVNCHHLGSGRDAKSGRGVGSRPHREQEGLSSALIRGHSQWEAVVSCLGAGHHLLLSGVYIWLTLVGPKLGMGTNREALSYKYGHLGPIVTRVI